MKYEMHHLIPCRNGLNLWAQASSSLAFTPCHGLTARRVLRFTLSKPQFSGRAFASISPPALIEDVIKVPVGGNGSIVLSVLRQEIETPKANNNVILYLPRGPIFQEDRSPVSHMQDSRTADYCTMYDVYNNLIEISSPFGKDLSTAQEVLAAFTGANVVTLNYRLGYMDGREGLASCPDNNCSRSLHRYPTPIHDTLAGLDWILQSLRPENLYVFGSNIGGSLALSLALTESDHIQAVAAHEPICDWTGLDDFCSINRKPVTKTESTINRKLEDVIGEALEEKQTLHPEPVQSKKSSRQRKRVAPTDLVPLLKAREQFFQTPEKYFDAFASPMLFLRSAGKDVPKSMPTYLTGPAYPTPILNNLSSEDSIDLWDVRTSIGDEITESTETSSQLEERPSRRRRALSRWPSYGLDHGNASSKGYSKATRMQITLPYVKLYARVGSSEGISTIAHFDENCADVNSEELVRHLKHKPDARKSVSEIVTVLGTQAKDMVSVMRRACFWGEKAGNGDKRVVLRSLPRTVVNSDDAANQHHEHPLNDPNYLNSVYEAAHWFRTLMDQDRIRL